MKLIPIVLGLSAVAGGSFYLHGINKSMPTEKKPAVCVMRTIFGDPQPGVDLNIYTENFRRAKIDSAINLGKQWLLQAQAKSGGWGAGTHARQDIVDPNAVQQDPASTAMCTMALMRLGEKMEGTPNSEALKKAVEFLLQSVEKSSDDAINITTLTGTQPQIKLGQNIDVILTSQCLTNLLHQVGSNMELSKRLNAAIQKCVGKIQKAQDNNGSTRGGGWAPVLQSAFAVNAIELAQANNIKVDDKKLEEARDYQKKNFSPAGNAATADAAGVMLYAVSGNARATAKEKRRVQEVLKKAKQEGRITSDTTVTAANLQAAGLSVNESEQLVTSYQLNTYANKRAQDGDVISGFGNNGGEEFVSFLLTGESLIIGGGAEWEKWYQNTSTILSNIQNKNGSWQGHHCITSPVFCTATCLLILGIDKDIAQYDKISFGK